MKVKEESEKFGLKLNIQKTKIMASDPITWWGIDGETVEIASDFIFFCSITADSDCSHLSVLGSGVAATGRRLKTPGRGPKAVVERWAPRNIKC